jgi:hypothetical protein
MGWESCVLLWAAFRGPRRDGVGRGGVLLGKVAWEDAGHGRQGKMWFWRGLRTMAYSRSVQIAAKRQRSRDGKESKHCFRTNQELKTENSFAPFAPLPLCGKRASRWQEQGAEIRHADGMGWEACDLPGGLRNSLMG